MDKGYARGSSQKIESKVQEMSREDRKVTVIKAKKNLLGSPIKGKIGKRKVAAYARVSTDSDEQLNSYEAQISYYTDYITHRSDWEFAGIYTDEGISGLNAKKREGFQEMINDALDGKIDLIITKSVSRFARNTVDTLTYVRQLKEKKVEVYFEKENIYTLDSKGELLITIMSSLAQEESRSISENVTWGIRKQFSDGKVMMPYKNVLGFKKGVNGLPEIIPEEAGIVRYIYRLFMKGMTPYGIARKLEKEHILSPTGKEQWYSSTVASILQNEKYRGSALLQKKYTVDFLTKKQKVNEGEVQQYYIEDSHPAIIEPEEFDLVQAEYARRDNLTTDYSNSTPYSTKLVCGDCGTFYGSKVWHSNTKYKRTVWQCNNKFKNEVKCSTPHLNEAEIQDSFIRALSLLLTDKEKLLVHCRELKRKLTDCSKEETRLKELSQEMEIVAEIISRMVNENATRALNQEDYQKRYDAHSFSWDTAKKQKPLALVSKRSPQTPLISQDDSTNSRPEGIGTGQPAADVFTNILFNNAETGSVAGVH
jgi:site-specific DNA recombinase